MNITELQTVSTVTCAAIAHLSEVSEVKDKTKSKIKAYEDWTTARASIPPCEIRADAPANLGFINWFTRSKLDGCQGQEEGQNWTDHVTFDLQLTSMNFDWHWPSQF